MAIQVKFLEQWRDLVYKQGKSDTHNGQLIVLNTLIGISNKEAGYFKTLKSYLKSLEKAYESSEQPNVSTGT